MDEATTGKSKRTMNPNQFDSGRGDPKMSSSKVVAGDASVASRVDRLLQSRWARLTPVMVLTVWALGGVAWTPGVSTPFLQRVGSWPDVPVGAALDVAVEGRYAYVVIGANDSCSAPLASRPQSRSHRLPVDKFPSRGRVSRRWLGPRPSRDPGSERSRAASPAWDVHDRQPDHRLLGRR